MTLKLKVCDYDLFMSSTSWITSQDCKDSYKNPILE